MPEAASPGAKINWKTLLLGISIGVLLILVLLAIFWYFTRAKEAGTSLIVSTKTATPSAKNATPSTNKTKTLKEFYGILYDSAFDEVAVKAHSHTFSLSYPSDWSVTENDAKSKHTGGHYYLIAGTNSFTASISEIPGGIGGACPDSTPPPDLIVGSEKILVSGQWFYLTEEGSISKNEIKDVYIDDDPNYYCMEGVVPLDVKPGDNTNVINFEVSMGFGKNVAKDYFLNSSEYKTAKEIISSLTIVN